MPWGHLWVYPSGKVVDPCALRMSDITIEDIAHSLSMQARYNGHTPFFYSVAEHSVLVSRRMRDVIKRRWNRAPTTDEKLAGLLHDAWECYGGDVVSPIKSRAELTMYRVFDNENTATIMSRFGVDWNAEDLRQSVRLADHKVFLDEWSDLRFGEFRTPQLAEQAFLAEFRMLARAKALGR